jgi:hypothetical protein
VGGLARLDKDGRWQSYSTESTKGGLPNDDVLVLASGADGALCSVVTPASSRASCHLGCQCSADLVISPPAIDG